VRGKIYSAAAPTLEPAVKANACIKRHGLDAVVNNAIYCPADDSIAWDRNPQHIVPVMAAKYGPLVAGFDQGVTACYAAS
jgi:hypothetical protein